MRKLFFITLLIIILGGCGAEYDVEVSRPGRLGSSSFDIVCIDNVEYLLGGSGITPHLKTDGTPYLCDIGQ